MGAPNTDPSPIKIKKVNNTTVGTMAECAIFA